jgi:hypothetical protein
VRKIEERTGLDNFIFLKLQIESNGHWCIVRYCICTKIGKREKNDFKKEEVRRKGGEKRRKLGKGVVCFCSFPLFSD